MSLLSRINTLRFPESAFSKVAEQTWDQCALCSSHGYARHKEVSIAVSTVTRHGAWSRKRHLCYECAIEIKNSKLLDIPEPAKPKTPWGNTHEFMFEILSATGGGTISEIKKKAIELGYEVDFNLSATLRNMLVSDKWAGKIIQSGTRAKYTYRAAEELENAS